MIPCIKNKCLLFPVCQNKTSINCPEIDDYYNELRKTYGRDESWQYIKMCLKQMRTFKIHAIAQNIQDSFK